MEVFVEGFVVKIFCMKMWNVGVIRIGRIKRIDGNLLYGMKSLCFIVIIFV